LEKKDVIVINGGTYDIDKFSINRNRIIVVMTEFMLKYNNTNIILVNIPHRYDFATDSKVNLEIQANNDKLSKIAESLIHIAVVELELNSKFFLLNMDYI
jgi:hypothetical protein